jgi:hypothetical protein
MTLVMYMSNYISDVYLAQVHCWTASTAGCCGAISASAAGDLPSALLSPTQHVAMASSMATWPADSAHFLNHRPIGDRLWRHSMRIGTDSRAGGGSGRPPMLNRFADRADNSSTDGSGISRTASILQSRGGQRVLRRSVSESVARWAGIGKLVV